MTSCITASRKTTLLCLGSLAPCSPSNAPQMPGSASNNDNKISLRWSPLQAQKPPCPCHKAYLSMLRAQTSNPALFLLFGGIWLMLLGVTGKGLTASGLAKTSRNARPSPESFLKNVGECKDADRNKKLLGVPGRTTGSNRLLGAPGFPARNKQTRVSWPYY